MKKDENLKKKHLNIRITETQFRNLTEKILTEQLSLSSYLRDLIDKENNKQTI